MTYMVGSRHEGYGETGMAHLLEHLLFKGTPKHQNIPQELTSHGARPNGSTWFDRTNYFETFQATDENLRWALDLEADRMVNSFIAQEGPRQRDDRRAQRVRDGRERPGAILGERVLSTAFLWHNYGKSTIGARADLENVPIDRLQAFYRTYYQPDNAVPARRRASSTRPRRSLWSAPSFGHPEAHARRCRARTRPSPCRTASGASTLQRVGDVQASQSPYHVPAGAHPDAAAVDAARAGARRHARPGRLYKALVETKKASSVGTDSCSSTIRASCCSRRKSGRSRRWPTRRRRCSPPSTPR